MKRNHRFPGLYALTDTRISCLPHYETAAALLDGGARIIQLRDKVMTPLELYETACRIADLCRRFDALFIVNDRVDIAIASGADGVHLGQDDLPLALARKVCGARFIIGISTHTIDQALEAERGGADYIGFGPIFGTSTKDTGYAPRGLGMLAEVRAAVKIPVAAIGGITTNNAGDVLRAGADMLAVASAVQAGGDVAGATRRFVAASNRPHRFLPSLL
ncbi:MAG: thiamine phosphate synthase [Nitrospirae bacterium]|nr:thiamine phosphate synthase [Nitrospirota bacterium]